MQIDYNYFMNPANRPADIASAIVNNPSPKQRGIHSARIRQIMLLNRWDDTPVRLELYDFWNCLDKDEPLRDQSAALTSRFNRIIAALSPEVR